ncbi:hypothetical protein [Eikenella corrodens]|uniref:hypothetical protein n=1 Tax=Eikenella corrodens TaxID=539 RepID=UPI000667F34D|nr:hypothetical protein [Eikenella corrodens]
MFTSRDLGQFLYSLFNVLEVIGIVAAIVIAIIASVVCYHIKPQWMQKHRWLVPVPALIVLFVFLVIPYFLQKERDAQRQQELQQARAERAAWRKQYYEPAKARFDQLCQNAGEKIYRTADNVDGILLLKVRGDDEKYQSNRYNPLKDQMWEDAAINSEAWRAGYINSFFSKAMRSWHNSPGYKYVDVLQKDGSIIRYSGDWGIKYEDFNQELNPKQPARYAVTYENDISWENRKHWVAGTTIKVIDTKTNELIAEKTMYVFVPELGYSKFEQNPNPWGRGVRCPKEDPAQQETSAFIAKVLFPLSQPQTEDAK